MDAPVLQINSLFELDPEDEVRMTTEVLARKSEAPNSSKSQYILNQYRRGPKIGGGQHGTVYVCYDMNRDMAKRAMKVVSRKNPRQDRVKELRKNQRLPQSGAHLPVTDNFSSTEHKIRKEIAVMKKCRHPNVVRLLEVIDDKLYRKVYMIMEYLGGGEVKWRDDAMRPILRVDQIRRIARDVILGLEYLHQQGIIHRDIKPANLLWTEDRRMVKIADFGVAHISAAHAARFEDHKRTRSSADDLQLLFDDSELCKTAGTPSFLAPEVIYEYGTDLSAAPSLSSIADPSPSNRTIQAAPARPPITKAVDVWAFGVSLYGMLFGRVPYHPPGGNEYMLYRMICTDDWEVPASMGFDRLPTGGRPANLDAAELTQGALVVSLLERVLEKDASKRATLAEVKRHPWFMRDISNLDAWVKETVSPPEPSTPVASDDAEHARTDHDRQEPDERYEYDEYEYDDDALPPGVTQDEYETAVSQVKFRWDFRNVGKRISSFFKRSSGRSPARNSREREGVNSEPSEAMGRFARPLSAGATLTQHRPTRAKENARPARHQSQQFARKSLAIPSTSRARSVDRQHAAASSSAGTHNHHLYGTVGTLSTMATREDPTASMRSFSPTSMSDKAKSRFSLRQMWDTRRSPSGQTLGDAAPYNNGVSSTRLHGVTSISLVSAQGRAQPPPGSAGAATPASAAGSSPSDAFAVSPGMRAASWGNVADYGRRRGSLPHSAGHDHDVTSIYSGAGDELDDDVMYLGAGGIGAAPYTPAASVPPTPGGAGAGLSMSGFMPFVPPPENAHRVVPVATGAGGAHAMAVPPELLHGVTGRDPAAMADPASKAPARSGAPSRAHVRSPLVQAYASSDDGSGSDASGSARPAHLPDHFSANEALAGDESEFSDASDDDDSFFERTSESVRRLRAALAAAGQDTDEPRPTASQIFGEECTSSEEDGEEDGESEGEEEGSEEAVAVEFRRRRPSVNVPREPLESGGESDGS